MIAHISLVMYCLLSKLCFFLLIPSVDFSSKLIIGTNSWDVDYPAAADNHYPTASTFNGMLGKQIVNLINR